MPKKTVISRPLGNAASSADKAIVDPAAGGPEDALSSLAGRERRLHARAYHHWASLLGDARFPSIHMLDPEAISDFASNSVLLDFRGHRDDPVIAYIGSALRGECGLSERPERIGDLPERSLLARLTGHCDQILTEQTPAGFEAEFVNVRGHTTLYRGILLPYSSDGLAIDFVHGVVSWKEVADPLLQATLDSALLASVNTASAAPSSDGTDLWAAGLAVPEDRLARTAEVIAEVAFATGGEAGTPVVLAGHVAGDGVVAITAAVVGDAKLADRVLRASH